MTSEKGFYIQVAAWGERHEWMMLAKCCWFPEEFRPSERLWLVRAKKMQVGGQCGIVVDAGDGKSCLTVCHTGELMGQCGQEKDTDL